MIVPMSVKSEAVSMSQRRWLWVLAACAFLAGAAALVLAWQNAQLETELELLRRERQTRAAPVATQSGRTAEPSHAAAAPADPGAQPAQSRVAATRNGAGATGASLAPLGLSMDAVRRGEAMGDDQYPYASLTQPPGNAGQLMTTLEAFKISEEALVRNHRNRIDAKYPFAAEK